MKKSEVILQQLDNSKNIIRNLKHGDACNFIKYNDKYLAISEKYISNGDMFKTKIQYTITALSYDEIKDIIDQQPRTYSLFDNRNYDFKADIQEFIDNSDLKLSQPVVYTRKNLWTIHNIEEILPVCTI